MLGGIAIVLACVCFLLIPQAMAMGLHDVVSSHLQLFLSPVAAQLPVGTSCSRHSNCESAYCSPSWVCERKIRLGSTCPEGVDAICEKGWCNHGICAADFAAGDQCVRDSQCSDDSSLRCDPKLGVCTALDAETDALFFIVFGAVTSTVMIIGLCVCFFYIYVRQKLENSRLRAAIKASRVHGQNSQSSQSEHCTLEGDVEDPECNSKSREQAEALLDKV